MTDLNSAKQQADDAITWLARNVHEWPEVISGFPNGAGNSAPCTAKVVEGPAVEWKAFTPADGIRCFSKQQWLARRTVLQNKPSWDDAPEWAEWLAQDEDGEWKWLAGQSGRYVDGWTAIKIKGCCKGLALGDWRNTLERQPQEAKSEPNQEPSSDDWHKRGELPPAGEICVLHAKENNGEKVMFIGITSDSFPVFETFEKRVFVERGEYRFTPLQTERERVASELVDVMMAVPVSDRKTATESYMSMALAIYDHLHPESKP